MKGGDYMLQLLHPSRKKRLEQNIELAWRCLTSTFRLRNLKNAFKTVTHGWRQYICFFVAVFVLQAGLATLALMTETNIYNAEKRVTDEYSHHVEIRGLDQEQKVNLQYAIDLAITRLDPYIQSATIHKEVDDTYTFEITFVEGVSLSEAYNHVLSQDILGGIATVNQDTGMTWHLRVTPLYTYEQDFAIKYTATYVALFLLWTGLSVLVMWVLYRVRVNHFRFVYGVYMTCGADFPKLYGTAGGELLMVSLLTCVPASLVGVAVTAGAYLSQGLKFFVSWGSVVGFVLYNLLVILLSVHLPMRRMASKPPIQNLTAGDNTPLVSSPRRSFRMYGSGYPIKYELFGMWRLRKYYVGLVLSAVIFAATFVSGFYIADLSTQHADLDPYEYLVHYGNQISNTPGETLDEETADMILGDPEIFLDDILATPGVSYVDWSVATRGGSLASHLCITPAQLAGGTDSLIRSDERASEGYRYAMLEYSYTAFDKLYVDMLVEQELCTFEGDPYALFEGERQVIISETSFNRQAYDFKPGDKVLVAKFKKSNGKIDMVVNPDALLRMQIEKYEFTYIEYTVCAVMHGKASENNITFGITFEEYLDMTGKYPVRDQLKVYMENGSDFDTVSAAEDGIRQALRYCSGWQVTPSDNYFRVSTNAQKRDSVMIYTLATLLLVISPLVWFFSQILYYRKRAGEFEILLALGGKSKSIPVIHRLAGGVLATVAFVATILLSCLLNSVVHIMVNTLLPKFGLMENVGYDYQLSLEALLACIGVSIICGFLSCEVSYRLYKRARNPRKKAGYSVPNIQ